VCNTANESLNILKWLLIIYSVLPVGVLGEEAGESRNKYYKIHRRDHARKSNRRANLTDVFCRAMDSSDPLLSSQRRSTLVGRKKARNLPPEVVELLQKPSEIQHFPELTTAYAEDEIDPDDYFAANEDQDADDELESELGL
jgi:hypothetical protein